MIDKTFYLSPDGNDNGPGTREEPFATLTAARNAARYWRRKEDNAGTAEIILLPGTYPVCETLELDREDNNTVIRGETQGTARLYGGTILTGFEPVTDEAILERLPEECTRTVYQCDLKQNGITDYGVLSILDGCYRPETTKTLECYCNGKRLQLARWPKEGFLYPKSLVQAGEFGGATSILEYDSPRHERWINAEDPWLFGYFRWLWADSTIPLGAIDTGKKHLLTAYAYVTPGGSMDDKQGIIYYAFNLLEELSEPGEYYLNRNTGILYFIPPCPIEDVTLEIGMFADKMIRAEKTQNITIKDLDFDLGRADGILFSNCSDTLISGCKISRFAGTALDVQGGFRCKVMDNDIGDTGRLGINIIGGNRETLTPGEHEIINNHLHDTGNLVHTYTPPVRMAGCGNRIAYNTMYNCPSSAIRIDGNDLIVEYNDIHSVDLESDDQGATDTYGNPTYRGMIFRYNYIHDIGKRVSETTVCGAAGIRLDDLISGVEIYGNIFESCSQGQFGAIQMNSGRDNRIHDNLFLDCCHAVSGGWGPYNAHYKEMRNGNLNKTFFFNERYLTRYPELKNVLDMNGTNYFEKNVLCGCGGIYRTFGGKTDIGENLVIRELGLTAEEAMERGRKEIGFEPINMAQIGAHYHEGCRWTPENGKSISKPLDWKKDVPFMKLTGDAALSSDWRVFGTFTEADRLLTEDELTTIPESLVMNGKTILPQTITASNNIFELNDILDGTGAKRVAWIFAKLETAGGVSTIGCGFDWWGTIWIDGKEIYSTGDAGNVEAPVSAFNHRCEVDLAPGKHVVAVRILTGGLSGNLALAGAANLKEEWNEKYWWLAQ